MQVSKGQAILVGQTADHVSLQDSLLGLLDTENILAVFSSVTGQESGVQTAERRSAQMRKRMGSCELLSPVDGIVTEITPLSAAQAETTLVVVADPESLQMSAQLPEAYVQDVAVGMPCIITGNAFRDHRYTGVITEIAPFAYTEFSLSGDGQRVVDLTIRVDDPDEALYAGYSAEARIQNYVVEDALFIPHDAVMQDENRVEYVYVIHMGRAFRRDIRTGQEIDGSVEVKEGLAAGEHVICNPQLDFYDGMPVRQER